MVVVIDPCPFKVKGGLGRVGLEVGIGGSILTLFEKFADVTDTPAIEPISLVGGVETVWTMVFVVFLIETE